MYKVEKQVLDDVVKILDGFNKPVTSKTLNKRIALHKKAAKLSQLIKDNYTDVKVSHEDTNN